MERTASQGAAMGVRHVAGTALGEEIYEEFSKSDNWRIRELAGQLSHKEATLDRLAGDESEQVRVEVARNPYTQTSSLEKLLRAGGYPAVCAALNAGSPDEVSAKALIEGRGHLKHRRLSAPRAGALIGRPATTAALLTGARAEVSLFTAAGIRNAYSDGEDGEEAREVMRAVLGKRLRGWNTGDGDHPLARSPKRPGGWPDIFMFLIACSYAQVSEVPARRQENPYLSWWLDPKPLPPVSSGVKGSDESRIRASLGHFMKALANAANPEQAEAIRASLGTGEWQVGLIGNPSINFETQLGLLEDPKLWPLGSVSYIRNAIKSAQMTEEGKREVSRCWLRVAGLLLKKKDGLGDKKGATARFMQDTFGPKALEVAFACEDERVKIAMLGEKDTELSHANEVPAKMALEAYHDPDQVLSLLRGEDFINLVSLLEVTSVGILDLKNLAGELYFKQGLEGSP